MWADVSPPAAGELRGEHATSPPCASGARQLSQQQKGCYLTLPWASRKCFFQLQEENKKEVMILGESDSQDLRGLY